MKRLILLVALVVILANLSASAVSDTSTSLASGNVTESKPTVSQTEASNSSASGTITITMYAVNDEWSNQ